MIKYQANDAKTLTCHFKMSYKENQKEKINLGFCLVNAVDYFQFIHKKNF